MGVSGADKNLPIRRVEEMALWCKTSLMTGFLSLGVADDKKCNPLNQNLFLVTENMTIKVFCMIFLACLNKLKQQ